MRGRDTYGGCADNEPYVYHSLKSYNHRFRNKATVTAPTKATIRQELGWVKDPWSSLSSDGTQDYPRPKLSEMNALKMKGLTRSL